MFDDFFEVYLADTPESKAIHHNIRYQVYCEEMGFEDKGTFPNEQEKDNFDDDTATLFIAKVKGTDEWVGAVRLIHSDTQPQLPLESFCSLDDAKTSIHKGPKVEVSRLCVVKSIRRRIFDGAPPTGDLEDQADQSSESNVFQFTNNRRINQSVIWGLLYAAASYCENHNIPNWYFMTTAALSKMLSKKGMELDVIGTECNHNGVRIPYQMNVEQILTIPTWQKGYETGYLSYKETYARNIKAA